MISEILNKRIGQPFETLIQTLNQIDQPHQLLQIEQALKGKTNIRKNLSNLKAESRQIIFSI